MSGSGIDRQEARCAPFPSMGAYWSCSHQNSPNCPYALKFGYIFICNNTELHNKDRGRSRM
jgi:hypothetical protein